MRSLFHSGNPEPTAIVEPAPTIFPEIAGADIAAVFVGKRIAGDFYDSIRVSPQRVLIGLLDVAGRREDNRNILTATQEIFRNSGIELFSKPDINESDAMTELNLRLNRGLIEVSTASAPARPSSPAITKYSGRSATPMPDTRLHSSATAPASRNSIRPAFRWDFFPMPHADARIVGLEKGAALLLVSRGLIDLRRPRRRLF